jgi:hypothetical protein
MPESFHRNATRSESGDQAGFDGAVPVRLGRPTMRSMDGASAACKLTHASANAATSADRNGDGIGFRIALS